MARLLTLCALLLLPTATSLGQTGTCEPAEAEAFLDVNNVRARILNNGGLFWKGDPHVYEVPKYGGAQAIFASGIWIGGKVNNDLRVAGASYGPWEFWPGPLDEQGNPPADCTPFDRIYSVYQTDITAFDTDRTATEDLLNWPWELGAPVIDGDGNPDNYNLRGGDRPEIMGHQTLWWVMNDRGNMHEKSKTDPIGLEVQVTAFAATSSDEHIDNATLYRLKITYKGDAPVDSTYFGLNIDADVGYANDDYAGSDSTLQLAYVYNSDNLDEGTTGYGEAPPAIGYTLIQGPLVDNDGFDNNLDGAVDESGERLPATSIIAYNAGGDFVTGDIETGRDIYNYLKGFWKNGSSLTFGGEGWDYSGIPVSFIFPGDPITRDGWTEFGPRSPRANPPTGPIDRRIVLGSGPFTMQPGEEQEMVFAIVWGRGDDNFSSITRLKEAAIEVQRTFASGFDIKLPQSGPLQTVRLSAPANGVTAQPIDPTLHWQALNAPTMFDVEWSTDPSFSDAVRKEVHVASAYKITELAPASTYYWRVRATNAGKMGPWSETWQFSTSDLEIGATYPNFRGFLTVQNNAGPIDPPDMAAFAFENSGFPVLEGNITPAGSYPDPQRPTSGVQQSTNNSVWGIHTGGTSRRLYRNDGGQSFLERSVRNASTIEGDDFEWRFTQHCLDQMDGTIEPGDCLGWRAFTDGITIELPFELWNTGMLPDTTDDYLMIPIICEEACGAGTVSSVFDIGLDHASSPEADDPFTDFVYWYKPDDNGATPGRQGYLDYFFGASALGDEVFARTVLVQLDGGSAAPYTVSLPEPGTIFRIESDPMRPPVLSAPVDGDIQSGLSIALYWHALPATYHLQVDRTPDFQAPLINFDFLQDPFLTTDVLPKNETYYWRVRMLTSDGQALSEWSDTWQFTIPVNVGSEQIHGQPLEFKLSQNYPNPFHHTTHIRYALPQAAKVQLEVYDTLGRRVSLLQNKQQPAGWHEASFDGAHLANGVYFYRLTAGDFSDTKTMILMR